MRTHKKWMFGLVFLLSACDQVKTDPGNDLNDQPFSLENQTKRMSYIFGMDSARNIRSMEIDFDLQVHLSTIQ